MEMAIKRKALQYLTSTNHTCSAAKPFFGCGSVIVLAEAHTLQVLLDRSARSSGLWSCPALRHTEGKCPVAPVPHALPASCTKSMKTASAQVKVPDEQHHVASENTCSIHNRLEANICSRMTLLDLDVFPVLLLLRLLCAPFRVVRISQLPVQQDT